MGLFTSIYDTDNVEWQIKCGYGYDRCAAYRLGDTVQDWEPSRHVATEGYMLDGVYWACSSGRSGDVESFQTAFVIVKDHVIVAIEPWSEDDKDDGFDPYIEFFRKYGLHPDPKDWWSERAWRRLEAEERKEMEFLAKTAHMTKQQRSAARATLWMANYSSHHTLKHTIRKNRLMDYLEKRAQQRQVQATTTAGALTA